MMVNGCQALSTDFKEANLKVMNVKVIVVMFVRAELDTTLHISLHHDCMSQASGSIFTPFLVITICEAAFRDIKCFRHLVLSRQFSKMVYFTLNC